MTLFTADLDNTLIYSYRHDIGERKRCAERYEGREISFLTEETHALLRRIKDDVTIVPVTTRTKEQYERVDLGIGGFSYALVCNGGILLVDGKEDEAWYRQSLLLAADAKETLARAGQLLERDKDRCFEIRNIRGLFLFTKSEKPPDSIRRLRQELDGTKADCFSNGSKIYVVPKKIDKGTAVLRLKERLHADALIAAGDSSFDIPMLNAADLAFAPKELFAAGNLSESAMQMPGRRIFSEELLSCLKKFLFSAKEKERKNR